MMAIRILRKVVNDGPVRRLTRELFAPAKKRKAKAKKKPKTKAKKKKKGKK